MLIPLQLVPPPAEPVAAGRRGRPCGGDAERRRRSAGCADTRPRLPDHPKHSSGPRAPECCQSRPSYLNLSLGARRPTSERSPGTLAGRRRMCLWWREKRRGTSFSIAGVEVDVATGSHGACGPAAPSEAVSGVGVGAAGTPTATVTVSVTSPCFSSSTTSRML